jgi:hypothetical protein
MSIAYSTLKAEILELLDLDADDATAEDRYGILNAVNQAQRSILRQVPLDQVDNILETALGSLLVNVAYYAWPSDFIRIKQVWVDYAAEISDTNLGKPVTEMHNGQFVIGNIDKSPNPQYPKFFMVDGGWELRPMPTANQTNGYQLQYVYNPPAISDSQPSLLRDDLKNALIFRAAEFSSLKGGNGKAEYFQKVFLEELSGLWNNSKESNRTGQ